jgi:hypothetical protein
MSPSMACSDNVYDTLCLKTGNSPIRLLTILPGESTEDVQCKLYVAYLALEPEYEAVSYTWGPPPLVHSVYINNADTGFMIRANLRDVFIQLRRIDQPRTVWIDAICINQNDLEERSQQVRIMRDIFFSATRVVVCLGRASKEILKAVDNADEMNIATTIRALPEYVEVALQQMSHMTYWSRVWIVQEIVLARDVIILIDKSVLQWQHFQCAIETYMKAHEMRMTIECVPRSMHRLARIVGHRSRFLTEQKAGRRHNYLPRIEPILLRYADMECTDFRDRIYGILGLTDRFRDLPVDYGTGPEILFLRTLARCNPTPNLNILTGFLGYALQLGFYLLDYDADQSQGAENESSAVSQNTTVLEVSFWAVLTECLRAAKHYALSNSGSPHWNTDSSALKGYKGHIDTHCADALWKLFSCNRNAGPWDWPKDWPNDIAESVTDFEDSGPQGFVYSITGIDLIFIFPARWSTVEEVRAACVVAWRPNLRRLSWPGAVVGPARSLVEVLEHVT